MATNTSRLGLRQPATTDQVNVDTDLSENFEKVDLAIGHTLCTSGARPATPFQGQSIFETDTGKAYVRAGANWIQVATAGADFTAGDVTVEILDAGFVQTTTASVTGNAAIDGTTTVDGRLTGEGIGVPHHRVLTVSDVGNVMEPIGVGASEFSHTLRANARYAVEAFVPFSAAETVDILFAWTVPSGTTLRWSAWGITPADNARIGRLDTGVLTQIHNLTVSGDDFLDASCRIVATVLAGATAGDLILNFAPGTGSTSVTVRDGAWIRFTRIA